MKTRKLIIAIVFAAAFVFPVYAQDRLGLNEIVNRMDKLYRSDTSEGRIEMSIVTENWKLSGWIVFMYPIATLAAIVNPGA